MEPQNAKEPASGHVRIHGQCGACGQLFKPRENTILSSTEDPLLVFAFKTGPIY